MVDKHSATSHIAIFEIFCMHEDRKIQIATNEEWTPSNRNNFLVYFTRKASDIFVGLDIM